MFYGNEVTVDYVDDAWTIYRFDEAGEVTKVILPTEAMDELRAFFRRDYAACRADVETRIAAQREP